MYVLSVTYAAGAAAGPLLGGALQAQTDFRGQCTVTAALCLVFSIIYLVTMPRRLQPKEED